jgi:muramoyltetrapeptide carboxypeptidase LdcA involved in peptidoglycan recycling
LYVYLVLSKVLLFSDITALHYYMSLYYPKIKTIHGMVSGSKEEFL